MDYWNGWNRTMRLRAEGACRVLSGQVVQEEQARAELEAVHGSHKMNGNICRGCGHDRRHLVAHPQLICSNPESANIIRGYN